MKKRNQIVSALITSVLLGGTATASVTPVPLEAAAEEGKVASENTDTAEDEAEEQKRQEAEEQARIEEEAQAKAEAEEQARQETEVVEQEEAVKETAEQPEPQSEAETEISDEYYSEGTREVPEEGNQSDASENGGQSSTEGDQTNDQGNSDSKSDTSDGNSDANTESGSKDSGDTDSNAADSEKKETDGEEDSNGEAAPGRVTGENEENPDAEKTAEDSKEDETKEDSKKADEDIKGLGTEVKFDEPIPYKTPEQISAEEMAEQIAIRKAAELERKREENEKIRAAAQEAAEEARKAELEAQAARRYSYAGANRAYYSGTYFVTNAQKRLALSVGFKTIEKRPAMAAGGETVNIREAKNDSSRVVGILDGKDVCYLLSDENDGSGWVYVESGEVRGFAQMSSLKSGSEVSDYVTQTGDTAITTAEQLVDPLENTAYRYSLNTTKDVASIIQALGTASVNRQAMLSFGLQFVGNPYVWGGESLTTGCDCSGFTQQVYAQFGISLPRTSYEQAEVGVKIPAEEALPGDLLFYARDGVVYHVLMYMGDGKAVNASSSATGIIVSDVDYGKVCWGCRYISDSGALSTAVAPEISSTQASSLQAIGQMAYEGDAAAQEAIIEALAQASLKEWKTYGFCRSVIIAQAIEESGWLSFGTSAAGIQATDNNVLGMNEDLNNSTWASPWGGKAATRLVPQYVGGGDVYNFESMRLYDDMEGCMEDYAAFKVGLHPDLIGETDVDHVIAVGLAGYATNPNYQSNIRSLIDRFNLTRFDQVETAAIRPEIPEDLTDELDLIELPDDLADQEAAAPIDGFADETELEDSASEETTDTESSSDTAEVIVIEENAPETPAPIEDDENGVEILYTWVDEEPDSEDDDNDILLETVVTPSEMEEDEDTEEESVSEKDVDSKEGTAAEELAKAAEYDDSVWEDPKQETSSEAQSEAPYEEGVEVGEPETYAGEADGQGTNTKDLSESEERPLEPKNEETKNTKPVFETTARSASGVRLDLTDYTEGQLELIWAVVAQEDDTSYDGALAVISSVMNRADVNYGGFGSTAFDQLTAESQYAYSADVEDPLYYERRLGGNVPDFVKQAVSDCLKNGIRNNSYTSFRSSDYIEGSVQIGANYYFFETAGNAAEAIKNMSDVIGDAAEEVEAPSVNIPDGVYDQAELPEAYYLPNDIVEDASENAEIVLDEAPGEDEAEEIFYGGIDDDGYVVIEAVPDFGKE